jgi:TPR repeat protein
VRWFREASEHHNPLAQLELGKCYLHGSGVGKDLVAAYMWFQLAEAQHNEDAHIEMESLRKTMSNTQQEEGSRRSVEWIKAHGGKSGQPEHQ